MINIPVKECDTAEEFLDYLQIRKSHWLPEGEWTSLWVFRGHGDAEWPLLPRMWRDAKVDTESERVRRRFKVRHGDNLEILFQQTFDRLSEKAKEWLGDFSWQSYLSLCRVDIEKQMHLLNALLNTAAEIDAIVQFIDEVDKIGYPTPRRNEFGSWEAVMLRHMDFIKKGMGSRNIDSGFLIWDGRNHPATALAQHHGIPTSLLDWSHKPMFAALFAAEDVALANQKSKYIAVWALHSGILDDGNFDNVGSRLQKLTVPKHELDYLHAQDSLFIYDSGADIHFIKNGKWPTIESVILSDYVFLAESPLLKITLPSSQAGELVRLLWAEGITRANIMPTYDNVTKALKTRWHWL